MKVSCALLALALLATTSSLSGQEPHHKWRLVSADTTPSGHTYYLLDTANVEREGSKRQVWEKLSDDPRGLDTSSLGPWQKMYNCATFEVRILSMGLQPEVVAALPEDATTSKWTDIPLDKRNDDYRIAKLVCPRNSVK